jgi:aquaporin Z
MANRPNADTLADQPAINPGNALRSHWTLYLMEASELAIFMIAACACTVWIFGAGSGIARVVTNPWLRRTCMGLAMGLTAIGIIHSPMGKRSGAHFNPAITLTYFRLGKIGASDALFYVLFQFLGGAAGVGGVALWMGARIAQPTVKYAVTVPGVGGVAGAFAAETFMAFVLMGMVLYTTNRPRFAQWTSYIVGVLICFYILLFAPVSGFSINPARTVGSAVFAGVWTSVWVYFTAPLLGMFAAAEVYLRSYGSDRILCAKLHPAPGIPCPFFCRSPGHPRPGNTKTHL